MILRNTANVDVDWNRSSVQIKSGKTAKVEDELAKAAMEIYPFLEVEPVKKAETKVKASKKVVKAKKASKPKAKK